MAAAYAALVSLLNTMDQIQIHPRLSTCFDNYLLQSLRKKVDFVLDFVENYSDAVIPEKTGFLEDLMVNDEATEAEDLMRRIAAAAHEAEDAIEVEAADRIHADASTQQSPSFIHKVIQDMDYIMEKVVKIKEETGFTKSLPSPSPSPSLSPPPPLATASIVGFDSYLERLWDQLTGHHAGRIIIPIVGMGGIGKTTLARKVYESSHILRNFNVHAWVTVSQEFSARKFFLQALSCLGVSSDDRDTTSDQQLSLELHKILFNRRYLIILDDVWSVDDWDRIKSFFPENKNKSRIVITTRESKLIDFLGFPPLSVDFLDDKNSWDLFCAKAFAQQGCPSELEEVGRKIVEKCKGLPLAIVVIGGLLRESPKSQEYWEKIAKEKHLVLDSVEGYKPLNILYLSYKYLPLCLKLCVLYLGICADYGVEMTELIRLWVAEGFIKPNKTRSLEEVAEGYLDDLVHRNLLFHSPLIVYREMVRFSVHDLVRDLCMRISEKESLFCVERDQNGKRHVAVDKRSTMLYTRETVSHHRPIISRERWAAGRLRVLVRDIRRIDYTYPEVNSRLLYHEADKDDEYSDINPHDYWSVTYQLSPSISLLWSLQTIIVTEISDVVAPSEIWEMPQLRHIDISSVSIPSPAPSSEVVVLHCLQTLRDVEDLVFTEDVCKRTPNVKELEISHYFNERGEASSRYHLHDVGRLDKLEKLVYSCSGWEFLEGSSRNLRLPSSLRELQLNYCKLDSCDVKILGSLPHLELLLLHKVVVGQEWDFGEEEFDCLKHLNINQCDDLICWIADSYTFPVLERLSLKSLSNFEEIPSGIGEIPTLQRISMYDCRESACISAVNILEEKEESFGHFGLRVEIKFSKESEAEMLREKVEFGSKNLLISGFR